MQQEGEWCSTQGREGIGADDAAVRTARSDGDEPGGEGDMWGK